MMQVGPDDAVLNFCKWPRKFAPSLPENCLPGLSATGLYAIAAVLVCFGVVWFAWPYRKNGSRRARMTVGILVLICGAVTGVIGLSIIASGDSATLAENVPALPPPQPAPSSTASSGSPPAVIDQDDNAEANLKNIKTNGTGTFLKQRGNSKISIENGSATFPGAKFPVSPLSKEENALTNEEIRERLKTFSDELFAFEIKIQHQEVVNAEH
jgi:hypothetical protein